MKEILKTTEHYRVEKWINSNTYAIIFFDEMRYIDGTFNKNFIEKRTGGQKRLHQNAHIHYGRSSAGMLTAADYGQFNR